MNRLWFAVGAFSALCAVAGGCSSSPGTDGGTTGAGSSSGGLVVGSTSGGASGGGTGGGSSSGGCQTIGAGCNQVTPKGSVISIVAQASSAPAPLGGTVLDGTYNLTQAILYTGASGQSGPTGHTLQITGVVASGTSNFIDIEDGCGSYTAVASLRTTDAGITFDQSCPVCLGGVECLTGTRSYSVATTPTNTLILYFPQSGGTLLGEVFQ